VSSSEYSLVADSYEHSNKPWISWKVGYFLSGSEFYIFKNEYVQWRELVIYGVYKNVATI
jgi:hypothetical protein